MKNHKGFTLIELLVVIAIIGILSSVVLASLNTARGRGADAAIKSNLANIRAQAELYYDTNNSYGTAGSTCNAAGSLFVDATIAQQLSAAESANGSGSLSCRNSTTAWAVLSPLVGATGNWCVDSTGVAKAVTSALSTTACPAS